VEVGKRTWLGAGQVGCRLGVGIRAPGYESLPSGGLHQKKHTSGS
jgi:hypothetical protein